MGEERVPPGQSVTEGFPVLHYDGVPEFDGEEWRFAVEGAVEEELDLTWEELLDFGLVERTLDFHCVTGWSRLDVEWRGVPFRTVAEEAGRLDSANFATIGCGDGYTTDPPLEDLMRDDVLFATEMEGEPLSAKHGGPVRLVVPHKYAYKSAKWATSVTFTAEKELGYWEKRGYSDTADPWMEDRYS
ncbi:MAG: Sulfoxide reductase catalytic subunit YedY [Methanonatronarchaeales archaeon]|nr:Sulfoxide reductase catalytic subunit YedY [Methanonatronarchaeales archaeon]